MQLQAVTRGKNQVIKHIQVREKAFHSLFVRDVTQEAGQACRGRFQSRLFLNFDPQRFHLFEILRFTFQAVLNSWLQLPV